jgi:hypothetical protein
MEDLEDQLRRAFAPQEQPDGFARRVLEQAGGVRRAPAAMPRWMAAAAAALLLCAAGYGYREYQGKKAKREVLLAFRIAAVQVNHIQTQVSK